MTRIFENCTEAINEIERDIMEMGIKVHPHSMQNKDIRNDENFSTKEVQNYSFTIIDTEEIDNIVGDNLLWCKVEFAERICPDHVNPGDAYKLREDVWKEFLVDGQFDYTYNERFNAFEQIPKVIEELKVNPDTRQAIIHVHYPHDVDSFQKKRIPCSMYYQLMIRRNQLDIIYNMRSSDFDTHFKNDIWQAIRLRDYIALEIGISPGLFTMNIGSLHRYKNYTSKHVF